jgi:adenosine deaminase
MAAAELRAPIPKAELHLHIEGTLEPELAFEIAARNRLSLPCADAAALRRRYRFHNLQSFLDVYYATMAVLRTEQDFADLAAAYLEHARSQGVRHAEIFFDPQAHSERGVGMATVVEGLWSVLGSSEQRYGISTALIACFLRDRSAGAAMEALLAAMPYRDRIVAVGLDSAEVGHPPSKFADVFDRARAEGFRCVAHAGEEGPAGYIWEALDMLRAVRIDHGIRCLDDPELVARLRDQQVPLTVCPLSNVRLAAVDRIEHHRLPEMIEAGLLVTVNSDDPAYFGGYIDDNYQLIRDGLGIDDRQLVRLAENSFRAAFLAPQARDRHLAELAEFSAIVA